MKRDGRTINFAPSKITGAIFKAASEVSKQEGIEASYEVAEKLTDDVIALLNKNYINKIPTVEQVQDVVVKVLIENGYAKTSQAYILYRSERSRQRESKTRLMKTINRLTRMPRIAIQKGKTLI